MDSTTVQIIIAELEKFGEKIGQTGTYLWTQYIEYIVIKGWTNLLLQVISGLLLILIPLSTLLLYMRRPKDDIDEQVAAFGWTATLIAFIIGIILITNGLGYITSILTPEGAVIDQILHP